MKNIAFKYIIKPSNPNKIVSLKLTLVKINPAFFVFIGVNTETIALCKGPFIPPIIITKNPGIIYA